ncbi:MAG: glycosyl hydrolase family 18 protein [Parachlamydia sp.]|nr:glycosyl hydrolase family 18 protein [Parachlamydia sp.]
MFKSFFLLCLIGPSLAAAEAPIIAAYYANDSQYRPAVEGRTPFKLEMIEPALVTDLYFAFATFGYVTRAIDPENPRLTGDYKIRPTMKTDESTLFPRLLALKKASKGSMRLFLSVGGWHFNNRENAEGQLTHKLFSQMVAKKDNRRQFIHSAIQYAHRFGFDGIDIDWEYPGDPKRGGTEKDFQHFRTFLKECKEAFEEAVPPLMLSITVPPFIPYAIQEEFKENPAAYFEWAASCAQHADRINIMAYDYHGPYNDPKITGANAPLLRDTSPGSPLYIAETLKNYLSQTIPSEKILLGLPLFGRTYAGVEGLEDENKGPGKPFTTAGPAGAATKEKGLLAYYEIADRITKKELIFGADSLTNTVFGAQLSTKTWVSFDNPDTIQQKTELAKKNRLGGVIFWTIDQDEYMWEPKFPNIMRARQILLNEKRS